MVAFWTHNRGLLVFLLLLFTVRGSFADWYDVPTGSMKPTIMEGDRILVDKTAYTLRLPFSDVTLMKTGDIERGDIVIIDNTVAETRLVKRAVALGGDCVSMHNNQLSVNGEPVVLTQTEGIRYREQLGPKAHEIQLIPARMARSDFGPICVPDGMVLVLGDNRNNSRDSRYFGFVPEDAVRGKAHRVLFSLDPDDHYLPRPARTLTSLM
ncbi:signal peptidase I [Alteromonas sp. CYL-A6]|uniref:signal peptidase I n=1 Tax=Alteromonas nitratireducens TaxID=3390813 RepID=UPI0034C07A94